MFQTREAHTTKDGGLEITRVLSVDACVALRLFAHTPCMTYQTTLAPLSRKAAARFVRGGVILHVAR